MKTTLALLLALFISHSFIAQDFSWATLIDVVEANEVAGMDVDSTNHVLMCGVFGDDSFLPYDGTAYLTKTDQDGTTLWTKYLGDELVIGDLICAGENTFIVAQSSAAISLDGVNVSNELGESFMAVIGFDGEGELILVDLYPDRNGQFADLDYHQGVIAMHCRGAGNTGDFVHFLNGDGTEISSHTVNAGGQINGLAYYNGWTYLTGAAPLGEEVLIDFVSLPAGGQDGMAFVLAMDPSFTAQWGHGADAINPNDSRIVAGSSGIYSYQSVLLPDFQLSNQIWKFDAAGIFTDSIQPPTYTSVVSLFPDMALSDCHLVLFASNAADNNSHEVLLFDMNLDVVDEKQINGNSNLYSGQVATFDNQIYVSHVHTDELDFNGEVMIEDDLDDAFQFPYLAQIAVAEDCGPVQPGDCFIGEVDLTLTECFDGQFFATIDFESMGTSDLFSVYQNGDFIGTNAYNAGPYLFGPFVGNGFTEYDFILVDEANDSCMTTFSFIAQDCGVGACVIDELVVEPTCISDSSYMISLNANFIDPTNDWFDLIINNDTVGSFPIDTLPLVVTDIVPTGSDYEFLSICVTDDPLCCFALDYLAPDCNPDALPEFDSNMSLYPNPSDGQVELQLPPNMALKHLELRDQLGRLVLQSARLISTPNGIYRFDISDLKQGIYHLRIQTDDGVFGRKLVKE